MKFLWALPASLLLLFSTGFAQSQPPATGVSGGITTGIGGGVAGGVGSGTGTVNITVQGVTSVSGLKGAPFSADTIHEVDRVLADGNHIHQESHGKTFRDSEGRTRTETEYILGNGDQLQTVSIRDQVEGTMIRLDPNTKTAQIAHFGPPISTPPRTQTEINKPATPPRTSHISSTSEDLGTMQIEGFTVTGTRHIRTIPAGEIGNDQPIVTTSETWFSPELKMILLSKSDDPQTGKSITKLVNIHAGEPDPSLFHVPADYTVQDNRPQSK